MIHTPNFCRVNQISRRTNKTTTNPDSESDYFSKKIQIRAIVLLTLECAYKEHSFRGEGGANPCRRLWYYQSKLTMTTDVKQCWYWTRVNVFCVLPELYISSTSLCLPRGHIVNLESFTKKENLFDFYSIMIAYFSPKPRVRSQFKLSVELEAWSLCHL